jgi:hypothetical protein
MMRPAFSSTKQAAAFALMLLILLLLPVIVGKKGLPPREEIYSSIWWASGDFPYIHQQIFEEVGNIDILFIGASRIHTALDTRYVQEKLSERLGRPAVVRTFGWGGAGYDQLYFMTQDLLRHRKVEMLVFDDMFNESDQPHMLAPRFFRFGDNAEALTGLPMRSKAAFFFASVLGMPRNLLSLIRPNLPADLTSTIEVFGAKNYRAPNPGTRLGSLAIRLGFNYNTNFEDYRPDTTVRPSDVCIYSPATKECFAFQRETIPPMQLFFARKFAALAREHGCKLALLNVPCFAERYSPVVRELTFWPEALNADVTMIGIPPAKLFSGLADDNIRKLCTNPTHFNRNGQSYFTFLITPALLQIYDSETKH